MEAKRVREPGLGSPGWKKKYEWKDHVIFMGILLAMAVWVNRGIEIKGYIWMTCTSGPACREQSFLQYVFPVGSTRFRFLYYLAAWLGDGSGQESCGVVRAL